MTHLDMMGWSPLCPLPRRVPVAERCSKMRKKMLDRSLTDCTITLPS
jgi:hypothetical protein